MNIEAYRQDRFVNWTVHGGTLWNFWSLIGIRPPPPPTERLYVHVTVPSAMLSDAPEEVATTVFDPRGQVVPGARVTLTVNSGTLTAGGSSGFTVESVTNTNGQVFATFRAPIVGEETMVLLTVSASHPDFWDTPPLGVALWIFPPGERFLSLRLDLPLGDLVSPGNALPLFIEVRNQDDDPVPDAVVSVASTNDSLLRTSRTNGTAAELTAILVEAQEPLDGAASAAILVGVSMIEYSPAEASVVIHVLPTARTYRCPSGEVVRTTDDCPPPLPAEDATFVVVGLGALITATAVAAILLVRRRR
jgi:hypothetical protein